MLLLFRNKGEEQGRVHQPSRSGNLIQRQDTDRRQQQSVCPGKLQYVQGSHFLTEGSVLSSWFRLNLGKGILSIRLLTSVSLLQIFSNEGEFKSRFGMRGRSPGQLQRPTGVAVHPSGDIIIADYDNKWVSIFSCEGKFKVCV